MHDETYPNHIERDHDNEEIRGRDYLKRLQFARDNGCNTVVITGNGEPLANMRFLERLAGWNRMIDDPFRWIELQTSGVTIDQEVLRFLRVDMEVSTISLSLSDMFDSDRNAKINCTPERYNVNIDILCREIQEHGFNLRLSLNMNSVYNEISIDDLFSRAVELGANQVTFRKLYVSGDPSLPQNQWIEANQFTRFQELTDYIKRHGRMLEILPFGAARYSVSDMSTVLDSDCMSTSAGNVLKYLILRPDCHLYTKWDDRGSLLF